MQPGRQWGGRRWGEGGGLGSVPGVCRVVDVSMGYKEEGEMLAASFWSAGLFLFRGRCCLSVTIVQLLYPLLLSLL